MKKRRSRKPAATMCATTTSKDWGFGPVSGKGGQTRNYEGSDTIIYREQKELNKD